jgi:hypothetical protein
LRPLIRLAAKAARHLLPQGEKEEEVLEKTPMPEPRKKRSWHDSLPFPRHWLGYIVLKLAVLVLAAILVLRFTGKL